MKFEKICKLYAKHVNNLHRLRLLEYFSMIQHGEALLRMVGWSNNISFQWNCFEKNWKNFNKNEKM